MLKINIPAVDSFDDDTQTFITSEEVTLELEHSLVSLSKWEQEWKKPFLSSEEKTAEESLGYIRAMTLTPDVPSEVFQRLTNGHLQQINEYIGDTMSATWFNERGQKPGRKEIITAEIIYYWIFTAEIPIECETWHLNRLFTLIRVFNQKNSPPKKMSRQEAMAEQRRINEARKAKMQTAG